MLVRLLSSIQAFFGEDRIVSGKVIAKHHYFPQGSGSDVVKLGVGKGQFIVEVPQVMPTESWSLTIEGLDKRGNWAKEELYVPLDVWSTTQVGDNYP